MYRGVIISLSEQLAFGGGRVSHCLTQLRPDPPTLTPMMQSNYLLGKRRFGQLVVLFSVD